jgi:hypothetical protein
MISLEKLRGRVPGAAAVDPLVLTDLIASAVELLESLTGRYFGPPEGVIEYLTGDGTHSLALPEPPLARDSGDVIGAVEERRHPGGPATTIPASGFDVRLAGNVAYLVRLAQWPWRHGYEYAVPYSRGYEIDAGPRDIEQLLIGLIRLQLDLADKNLALRSETISGYGWTRMGAGDLEAIEGAKATIAAWTRPVFA